MVERSRRNVLASTGLSIAAVGLLSTAGTARNASDDDEAAVEPTGWSSLGGSPGNTSYVPDERGPAEAAAPVWEYNRGGWVAVVDGTVYLVSDVGEVHALDADDGTREWQANIDGVDNAPAVAHETVYVGGDGLTALDAATGDVRWTLDPDSDLSVPAPNVAGDLVFVVIDGVLYAADAEGDERWQFEPSDEPLHEQSVAIADGAVIAASESQLFALEVDDGSERWTYSDSGDSLSDQFNPAAAAYPIATDDLVVAARNDDGLTLHDLQTGEERSRIDGFQRPEGTVTPDQLYSAKGMHNYYLSGTDLETGDQLWTSEAEGEGTTPPIADEDRVYTGIASYGTSEDGDEGDRFFGFDADDGSIDWQIDAGGRLWPLALADGTLYVGTRSGDGKLFAFRSERTTDDAAEDEESDDSGSGDDEEATDDDGDEASEGERSDAENGDDGTSGDPDRNESSESETSDDTESDETSENATESESDDDADESDGMPGFTAGAGVAGGALTLEWLRRQATDGEREA